MEASLSIALKSLFVIRVILFLALTVKSEVVPICGCLLFRIHGLSLEGGQE